MNAPARTQNLETRISFVRTTWVAALAGIFAMPAISQAAASPHWKAGQVLVGQRAGVNAADLDGQLNLLGLRPTRKLQNLDVHVVPVPAGQEDAFVKKLAKIPHVKFAEKDMLVPVTQLTPNDPQFSGEWHLAKIQAPDAWSTMSTSGVTVAVLDTGVDGTHPDLSSRLVQGFDSVAGTPNTKDTSDVFGHGTAVAGTVGAATNNGVGVASVAWNSLIMPIRVTDRADGYAYWSDVANGLTWAANNGARVANISFDGVTTSSAIATAAQYMRGKGGVVVAAAGNSGIDPGYADSPYIISVSATDSGDAKASWSNYGAFIDVAAPGAGIITTTKGGGYASWSGTSFSSPITAGVVALILNTNPSLTPDQAEKILESSADDPAGYSDYNTTYGWGRVNAYKAMQLAGQPAPDTQPPTTAIASPTAGGIVKGQVTVNVNASDNMSVAKVTLYVNGLPFADDATAPFSFLWDTTLAAEGNANLSTMATDAAGNTGLSAKVSVTVDNIADPPDTTPPTDKINSPADGAKLGNGSVTVSIGATDNVGVSRILFFINGVLKAQSNNSNSLRYSFNGKSLKAGTNIMTSTAYDLAGNPSPTATITVTH